MPNAAVLSKLIACKYIPVLSQIASHCSQIAVPLESIGIKCGIRCSSIPQHTLRLLDVFRRPFYSHYRRSEATRGIGAWSPQKTVRLDSACANLISVTHRPRMPAVVQTHSYTTAGILDELSMPYAQLVRS
jgi:hypothetical protein